MRKILAINNTIFYEENNKLYLNKETGNFFVRLKELGNAVSVFQISQPKTESDSFANFCITDKGIKIYEVKRLKSRFTAFLNAFFLVQKAILKNDFVYIFYPGPICLIIALMCIAYRKPYGLYIRGEQGINSKLSLKILKKAKIIFTISPEFTQRTSSYNSNTNTIRPMIGFSELDIKKSRLINFNATITLLYVGRLVFDKGLFELLDALKILKEKGHKVHLNMVGGGTDLDKLIAVAAKENLIANVTFYGMISDKDELVTIYNNSDIFVLPTYHEGFPRVIYEAMMMNIPIITTFVGTIGYLMKNQENCLEIKVKDVDSIVTAVEALLNSSHLAKQIADKGTNTIVNYLHDKKRSHALHLNQFIQQEL